MRMCHPHSPASPTLVGVQELSMGDYTALMDEYRRLAQGGMSRLSQRLPEGQQQSLSAYQGHLIPCKLAHLTASDLRMSDLSTLLDEYRALLLQG